MSRAVLVGVVAVGLAAGAVFAQGAMDCNALYKGFWDKYATAKLPGATAEELADISRRALRAYDACQAGDEFSARSFFDEQRRNLP
jgi:hypothetical protein